MLGESQAVDELQRRIETAEKGIAWLWNEQVGAYCSRDVITGHSSGKITSASFLSFYAGVRNANRDSRLLQHLERISGRVKYLLPSLDPEDAAFDSLRYWRGPVWAVVNFLVSSGLSSAGHNTWGDRIRSDTRTLIEQSGMYEYFCPVSGRGVGGDDFTWTAAMWLHWARHDACSP